MQSSHVAKAKTFPAEAFGIGVSGEDHLTRIKESEDYLFTITQEDDLLVLEIDSYSAMNGVATEASQFDTAAWEAGKVWVEAGPPSRVVFRELHRLARTVLSGRDVLLPSGDLLKGIRTCANI